MYPSYEILIIENNSTEEATFSYYKELEAQGLEKWNEQTAVRIKSEISSRQIGEMVMEKLKDLDSVAYVRFASVYREFKDVNTFMDELKKMLK